MYCNSCGAELKEGAKFCFKCGAKVVPQAEVVNTSNTANIKAEDVKEDNTSVVNKKKVNLKILIPLIVAGAILFLGGIVELFRKLHII